MGRLVFRPLEIALQDRLADAFVAEPSEIGEGVLNDESVLTFERLNGCVEEDWALDVRSDERDLRDGAVVALCCRRSGRMLEEMSGCVRAELDQIREGFAGAVAGVIGTRLGNKRSDLCGSCSRSELQEKRSYGFVIVGVVRFCETLGPESLKLRKCLIVEEVQIVRRESWIRFAYLVSDFNERVVGFSQAGRPASGRCSRYRPLPPPTPLPGGEARGKSG